jgi:hypothetical protein
VPAVGRGFEIFWVGESFEAVFEGLLGCREDSVLLSGYISGTICVR